MSANATNWDHRLLALAQHVAQWSKDPSTKVGAVITTPAHRILSVGFNGYPRGVPDVDLHNRDYKLARIVHAEMNALLFANSPLEGATMYVWPMPPCSHCAGPIIQAGIGRVVAPPAGERWATPCAIGQKMLFDAGVITHTIYPKGGEK